MNHYILGTAGHVDHGKSSLIKALTGIQTDRLPEEKKRGLTIDLGFAHLQLSENSISFEIGIIDVPGHADFINNMVTGVGAIDIALFVVAADDGWMPQSEEHLHILSYLGVKNFVIALTKSDLCEDVPFAIEMLKEELKDSILERAPIVPVSSLLGNGIDELRNALLEAVKKLPPHKQTGKTRLTVDRIFSPQGKGTVVTGTLVGSAITTGDTLILQNLGINTKVRSIQNHNQTIDKAFPGMRVALNLSDIPIQAPGKQGARRGHCLTNDEDAHPTRTLDVILTRSPRSIQGEKMRPLRHLETITLHYGTTHSKARVILHEKSQLLPGESSLAQLRLQESVFLFIGDHLLIRDGAHQVTLAGGRVLDTGAKRRFFRTPQRAIFLKALLENLNDCALCLHAHFLRDPILRLDKDFFPNNPFSENQIKKVLEKFIEEKKVLKCNNYLIDSLWCGNHVQEIEKMIVNYHQKHPDMPLVPLDFLSDKMPNIPPPVFSLFLARLTAKDYLLNDEGVSHKAHTISLPKEIKTQAEEIMQILEKAGLQPPNKSELLHSPNMQKAMQFLLRSGELIELETKLVITRTERDRAQKSVIDYISKSGPATASQLKEHLNTTRKIAMPLLEHLDSRGLTRRNDNLRELCETRENY